MIAVVAGMIASFPVGGVFFDYVQYALGLERLGFEVYYLEDTNTLPYDPVTRDYDYSNDWSPAAGYLGSALDAVSPNLGRRWHLRTSDGKSFGIGAGDFAAVVADADLFLNVSGSSVLRDEYLASRRKVYVDTDPGWNHFARWPKADARPEPIDHGWRAHDHYFTYAERLGRPDCALPDFGLAWHPTRPPVVMDLWSPTPAGDRWTTVLSWDNFSSMLTIEADGVVYGTKEREFARIEHLPQQVPVSLEVAAGGVEPPVERWRQLGWSVRDSMSVSATPDAYRSYISASRGEFSVAKHVLVATRCGWFSCRSTCYLAAGRPVVLQDTGFSEFLPTGKGVLAFTTADEAVTALLEVETDWELHAEAAREIAAAEFDSDLVLAAMVDRLELA